MKLENFQAKLATVMEKSIVVEPPLQSLFRAWRPAQGMRMGDHVIVLSMARLSPNANRNPQQLREKPCGESATVIPALQLIVTIWRIY
jgi:hypothetical protein